jgi:hypothetical protein
MSYVPYLVPSSPRPRAAGGPKGAATFDKPRPITGYPPPTSLVEIDRCLEPGKRISKDAGIQWE